jgi:hypothetical protein
MLILELKVGDLTAGIGDRLLLYGASFPFVEILDRGG